MKYFISIQYNRAFYQIRFSSRCLYFLRERCEIDNFSHVKIGIDSTKKILAFKPLEDETEDSYHFVNKSCISSVELVSIIQNIAEHSGLYRYPVKWHTNLALAVVDLKGGQEQ